MPLHTVLARFLRAWRAQTPFASDGDFVFPSLKAAGRVPLSASIFVADHLRLAAKKAGVHIEGGQRFGLHNLRHSLSNWLVNKAKVEPKTVQGLLRHSKIQTTLDLYTQEDRDETLAARENILRRWAWGIYLCDDSGFSPGMMAPMQVGSLAWLRRQSGTNGRVCPRW